MPRKKRTVAPAPVVPDVPKLPALTQEELLRLRLLDTEARLAAQEGQNTLHERAALLAKIDPQGRLAAIEAKRVSCGERERNARLGYKEALEAASKRLGIDLASGCAIDPQTGTVIQHEKKE